MFKLSPYSSVLANCTSFSYTETRCTLKRHLLKLVFVCREGVDPARCGSHLHVYSPIAQRKLGDAVMLSDKLLAQVRGYFASCQVILLHSSPDAN